MQSRNSTQQLERLKWDIEREIKKTLQAFSKKIASSPKDNQNWAGNIKSL